MKQIVKDLQDLVKKLLQNAASQQQVHNIGNEIKLKVDDLHASLPDDGGDPVPPVKPPHTAVDAPKPPATEKKG